MNRLFKLLFASFFAFSIESLLLLSECEGCGKKLYVRSNFEMKDQQKLEKCETHEEQGYLCVVHIKFSFYSHDEKGNVVVNAEPLVLFHLKNQKEKSSFESGDIRKTSLGVEVRSKSFDLNLRI